MLALLVLVTIAGCGGGRGDVVLTCADTGTTVELAPGDTLRLELASNATTGFSWQLMTEQSAPVELLSSRYLEPETGQLVGAGGTEIWTFRARERGEARIELVYARPFDPDVVANRFDVMVRVD